jgi:hypothetical protein
MKKLILLVMVCLCPFLQGCVGILVSKQQTLVAKNPVISSRPNEDVPAYSGDPNQATNTVIYTSSWLRTNWGKPYRVRPVRSGADEVWIYRFGPIWEGIMPCLIVPIPLELPLGQKRVCFWMRDGRVVSVSFVRSDFVGWGFGPKTSG